MLTILQLMLITTLGLPAEFNESSFCLFYFQDNVRNLATTMRIKTLSTFWRNKVIEPLQGFLAQGLSGKKLALSLALGVTLGTFPMLGATTILCALTALILKLNMPVIQFANYLVYPLQIILLVPYYQLGDLIFSAEQTINLAALQNMLAGGTYTEMMTMLMDTTLYAIGAWLLISPPILALLYVGLKPALVRLNTQSSRIKFLRRLP